MATPGNLDVDDLERQLSSVHENFTKKVLILWGRAMMAYLDRRFKDYSRGGGSWPPLAPSTIAQRRPPAKVKKTKEQLNIAKHFENVAILVDTGQLRAALNPRMTGHGAYEKLVVNSQMGSIEVGIGGADPHVPPKRKQFKKASRPITIAEIAVIQHYGLAKGVPPRPIVVPPDEKTKRRFEMILKTEIDKELDVS